MKLVELVWRTVTFVGGLDGAAIGEICNQLAPLIMRYIQIA